MVDDSLIVICSVCCDVIATPRVIDENKTQGNIEAYVPKKFERCPYFDPFS